MNPDIEVQGCYFGMYEYPTGSSHEKFHSYYFSPESGLVRKSCFSNSLFETIVSSLEGMTKSYDKVENGYAPVMNDAHNPNADQMKKTSRHYKCCWRKYLSKRKKYNRYWNNRKIILSIYVRTVYC